MQVQESSFSSPQMVCVSVSALLIPVARSIRCAIHYVEIAPLEYESKSVL